MNQTIDIKRLKGYKKTNWSRDYFVETIDKKYGLSFYNVEEQSMGAYYGRLSIFENSSPTTNSENVWIWYSFDNTFIYAVKSDCLIFRMPVFQNEDKIEAEFPYLLIKPQKGKFSFIKWDFTSIYYSFDEVETDSIKIKEIGPKELDNIHSNRRTEEIIKIDSLRWFDLNDFDSAKNLYISTL